jgi:hypothetical protein
VWLDETRRDGLACGTVSPHTAKKQKSMATAAKVAAAEAQNAAYREAKILQTDSVTDDEAAWKLTQVQLALNLDLDRRELSGAALMTVAPTSGATPDAMEELVLDIHELDVNAVSLPSEGLDELPFTVDPVSEECECGTVRIKLPSPSPGWGWSTVVVKVDYRARDAAGLCWIEDDINNMSGGPLFFMGHGTACGFPTMGTSTVGATHSAVVTVSVRSAAVAKGLKAILYTKEDDEARLHELVQRGVGQGGASANLAVTAVSPEARGGSALLAAEQEQEQEPEPEPGPDASADPARRVFELHVSDPFPCSALSLAIGCLDSLAVRSSRSDACGCEAPGPWCCCPCAEPCAGVET